MVELESVIDESDMWMLHGLVEDHVRVTGSPLGRRVLPALAYLADISERLRKQ